MPSTTLSLGLKFIMLWFLSLFLLVHLSLLLFSPLSLAYTFSQYFFNWIPFSPCGHQNPSMGRQDSLWLPLLSLISKVLHDEKRQPHVLLCGVTSFYNSENRWHNLTLWNCMLCSRYHGFSEQCHSYKAIHISIPSGLVIDLTKGKNKNCLRTSSK